VLGLEIGADDYITKDRFSLREFRSRVRAQLRRADMSRQTGQRPSGSRHDRRPRVDLPKRNVDVRGRRVDSPTSSSSCSRRSSRIRAASTRGRSCCSSSGATRSFVTRAPSTCTSATCARRSNATPAIPSSSSRSAISATSSAILVSYALRGRSAAFVHAPGPVVRSHLAARRRRRARLVLPPRPGSVKNWLTVLFRVSCCSTSAHVHVRRAESAEPPRFTRSSATCRAACRSSVTPSPAYRPTRSATPRA